MHDEEHLLDREREFASIDGLLSDAVSGKGGLLTACGPAGVGKSALLDHAARLAAERGMTVLRVRGSFAETDLHHGLVQRLFEPRHDIGTPAREPTREELNQALISVAGGGPMLVVIDDVHWADRPSLRWLMSLPLRIEHHSIAMLVSVCTGDPCVDPDLLDDLLACSVDELRPATLSVEATAELLGVDADQAAEHWAATGGNPALLHGLSTGEDVPALSRTVHVWLRRVSADAVAVARAVAVLDGNATLDRVASISGVELPVVADVVNALERKSLLHTRGDVVDFAFRLIRVGVVRELPFSALQRVHGQAARLLHESGAPAGKVAEHLLASGPVTEDWEVEALRTAAAAALDDGRPDSAVAWLRHAGAEEMPLDLLVELGGAEAHVDVPAAIDHLMAAAARGADVTAELAPLHTLVFGNADHPATRAAQLGNSVDDAVLLAEREFDGGPLTPAAAPAFLAAVEVLAQAGGLDQALQHCDVAVVMAERRQHRSTLGAARSTRSVVLRQMGRLDDAAADARAGIDLLHQCGVTGFEYTARLVEVLIERGDHAECALLLDRVPDTWRTRLLFGRLRAATGMPAGAVDDLRACGELCSVSNPAVAPWRSEAAHVLHGLGRKREAIELAGEEVERARRWGAPGPLAAALRAVADVARGPLGLATIEEALSVVNGTSYRLERTKCLIAFGAAQRRANQPAAARRTLREAINLATECQSPLLVDRAKAELTAAGGRLRDVSKSGPESLTAAEYRVASLAAPGDKTTKQIAEQLYVTRRTIEIHLTNAYRKLGIQGRQELRRVLPRKAMSA